MTSMKSTALALLTLLPATALHADLSPSDIAAVNGKSGIRVFSAEGSFLGLTNGVRIADARTRLFVVPRSGSLFRTRGKDLVITADTELVSLRGGDLIVEATDQRLRRTAKTSATNSFEPVRIYLFDN
ncbi:MAG: hypothetical protein AB3N17_19515 [Tateyamaria sp.]